MYSWEIDKLIRINNYILSPDEYKKIIISSPQIIKNTYEPYSDKYVIKTEDNYLWKFIIIR